MSVHVRMQTVLGWLALAAIGWFIALAILAPLHVRA